MTKTKRPDWKKQFDDLKAMTELNNKAFAERMAAVARSNNQAITDLQELIRLKNDSARSHALLDQAMAAIEKKLSGRDTMNW